MIFKHMSVRTFFKKRSDYVSRWVAQGVEGPILELIQKNIAKIEDGRYQEIQVAYGNPPVSHCL